LSRLSRIEIRRCPARKQRRERGNLLGSEASAVGADAQEAELKAVQSPRVLHLATHGFFLSDQEFRETNALGGFAQRSSFALGTTLASLGTIGPRWNAALPQNDWENPLVRCGIALAGANRATNLMSRSSRGDEALTKKSEIEVSRLTSAATRFEEEDGVLTGLEASLLNLQGTELVILSACQSGAGDVKIGEGLMSLRRAFRIAGAQTVLASHWSVSDRATSQLMTEFIRRWRAGEPRAEAWREAQLSLLRSKGAMEDFSNPFFWAAFTLTGQWR
jgi:CHAT domain-containing protein